MIEKAPPVARLTLPEVRLIPPPKVEVAVEVAVKYEAVSTLAMTAEPFTPSKVPGVVVPIPTLPFDRTVRAVVVAPAVGSAKMDRRERLESEEVAEIVRMDAGEDVPIPRYCAELGYIARELDDEVANFSVFAPTIGQVVLQMSPVKQIVVAERAPAESEVACPLVKKRFCNVDDAVVEVALKLEAEEKPATTRDLEISTRPAKVEVAVDVATTTPAFTKPMEEEPTVV